MASSRPLVCWVNVSPTSYNFSCLTCSCSIALLIIPNELMFLISALVPNGSCSDFLNEIFTSTLIWPFSKSASPISLYLTNLWSSFKNSITSSELLKSGKVTISTNGVPARLKSRSACHQLWIIFPVSFSMCASWIWIVFSLV